LEHDSKKIDLPSWRPARRSHQSCDDIIAEGGIEAFSLRAAAQRAGVSPGAPAHHFGSAKGLLTEVALLAFDRFGRYIEEVGHSDDVVRDVRALSLAFVTFALDHPGHYRLMFRERSREPK
jgi:AcrR family transcriptional regulator